MVSKREVREYLARPLEPEVERRILEAGRVAGSAKNRQPWTFVVVRDDAAVEAVAESVFEPPATSAAPRSWSRSVMNGGAGHRRRPRRAEHDARRLGARASAPARTASPTASASTGRCASTTRTRSPPCCPSATRRRPRDPARRTPPRSGSSGARRKPFDEVVPRICSALRSARQDREQRAELDLGLGQLGRRVGVAHHADARVAARASRPRSSAQRSATQNSPSSLASVQPTGPAYQPRSRPSSAGISGVGDRVRLAADRRASGAAARRARSRCAAA